MAHSVERLTSAQVMVSQFVGSSPASGFVLCSDLCICLRSVDILGSLGGSVG